MHHTILIQVGACGYGNYDIAGAESVKIEPKYKTESLAFNISGNIEKDFLQARAYTYTYWGEGTTGICKESGNTYNYGWSDWKSLNSKDIITLNKEKYFSFGGTGVNLTNNTDSNGNNPMPEEVAREHKYGISAIQLKLKSYEYYSIIYQVYIDDVGWIKSAKNGEIERYKNNKPISALRIALVPNSEVDALIKTWDKDVRKIYKLTFKNH